MFFFLFFFQAEDGIRDLYVTGVQTCALPILTTSYILVGIWLEERDLVEMFGDQYRDYKQRVSIDRKSTRLNSSHVEISYAVFCLKKKKKKKRHTNIRTQNRRSDS